MSLRSGVGDVTALRFVVFKKRVRKVGVFRKTILK